jgi:hypothetical protein
VHGSKGKILCHDNDAGLTKLYGKDAGSCLSAAASGVGCTMKGVANLCQCSCKKHRRRVQVDNAAILNGLALTHLTGKQCPWDQFDDRLADVSKSCCSVAGAKCSGSVPSACSFDCGRKFSALMLSCTLF